MRVTVSNPRGYKNGTNLSQQAYDCRPNVGHRLFQVYFVERKEKKGAEKPLKRKKAVSL